MIFMVIFQYGRNATYASDGDRPRTSRNCDHDSVRQKRRPVGRVRIIYTANKTSLLTGDRRRLTPLQGRSREGLQRIDPPAPWSGNFNPERGPSASDNRLRPPLARHACRGGTSGTEWDRLRTHGRGSADRSGGAGHARLRCRRLRCAGAGLVGGTRTSAGQHLGLMAARHERDRMAAS